MSVALACFSHSPLQLGYVPPADRAAHDGWQRALDDLAFWVSDYDPELVVVFYPDHFNGFFYRSMPSFCIGTEARGGIDWGDSRDRSTFRAISRGTASRRSGMPASMSRCRTGCWSITA